MDVGGIHFFAGAAGGTVGAVITCPLEVVKTRLQSSNANFGSVPHQTGGTHFSSVSHQPSRCVGSLSYASSGTISVEPCNLARSGYIDKAVMLRRPSFSLGLYRNIKYIVETEGSRALFKGLGPNLVGVAPSRAIYFWMYSQTKRFLNSSGLVQPDTPIVHILSAACAGFSSSTCTNPIWFIKTRLQLDHQANNRLSAFQCIRNVYRQHGFVGFYKGITASYYGLAETMIHFVVYEEIKILLRESEGRRLEDEDRSFWQFFEYMGAGATSKTIATCVAYPHEVARTRLREEGSRYKSFWQTLILVYKEDGVRGLYRGLPTQLVRQIPNTAIMMATYEAVVYMYNKHFPSY